MPTTQGQQAEHGQTGQQAKIVRLFRVLRLLKLLRMSRAARILVRWETRLGLTANQSSLIGLLLFLICINHWLACLWGLMANVQDPTQPTWMTEWLETQAVTSPECGRGWLDSEKQMLAAGPSCTPGSECHFGKNAFYRIYEGSGTRAQFRCWHPTQVYAACLHWSMMTVTSIGYGDIHPTNTMEYFGCVFFMLVSGLSWAMIIGQICGLAAAGDPVTKQYNCARANMDRIMDHMHIPDDLKQYICMNMKHTRYGD